MHGKAGSPKRGKAGWRSLCASVASFLALAPAPGASDTEGRGDPQSLFSAHTRSIVQIRIVEATSGAKRTIGSGFVIAPGELATNYHVVSDLVSEPASYRAEWMDDAGEGHPLALLGFDVVRDIAILRAEEEVGPPLRLRTAAPRNGDRIFAVGDPYDLGLSIVEGLYNGRLENSRLGRIHFSGSLNPGMSGGPAMLADGGVIGINVASMGNQVSFLVPVEDLQHLMERVAGAEVMPVDGRMDELRRQLWEHQEEQLTEILAGEAEDVQLGPYRAPSRIAPYFNCWGDVIDGDELLHRGLSHHCSTEDWIYISEKTQVSPVWLSHRQIESDTLSPSRFYALYSAFFEENWSRLDGSQEVHTEFRCHTRIVDAGELVFKATYCARRYLDLPGLFDVVFKAAHLGEDRMGFETALVMRAVGMENARRLASRHLEAIQWND